MNYPEIDPVALSFGPFELFGREFGPLDLHWYGVMYLIGFATAWLLAMRRAGLSHSIVSRRQVEDLLTYCAFGVIIGGRIGYVLFYRSDPGADGNYWWQEDKLLPLRVWEGGMSFHGGLLGVTLALVLYARKIKQPFLALTDFVAPTVPLALGFGRLGNFIGQELWGRASDVPWAMVFPKDPSGLARHPSQLYQATLEGLVLFVAVYWFSVKPRPRGTVTGLFLVLYGSFRLFTEFFREPDEHIQFDLFGWITRGQLLSVPMIALGIGLIVWALVQRRQRSGK